MKIVLGTVQFGINYGINNSTGKPNKEEVFSILDYAYDSGIREVDTADTYGDALEIIGEWQATRKKDLKVVSKIVLDSDSQFSEKLQINLERMSMKRIYGLYFHRFSDFLNFQDWDQVQDCKEKKLIERFGVSVYGNDELKKVVDHPEIDIIQVPFNLFDQGQEKIELLLKAKENNKFIYVRSVYLQGLFFKRTNELTGNLIEFKEELIKLQSFCSQNKLDLSALALGFCLGLDFIDRVIIGVDNLSQLKINLELSRKTYPQLDLQQFNFKKLNLLNPSNWKT